MVRAGGMRSARYRRALKAKATSAIAIAHALSPTSTARRTWIGIALALLSLLNAVPAAASETITYSYDARGRLIKVVRSGTINNGATECYSYDRAENRANVTTATSGDCVATSQVSFSIASNGPVTEGASSVFTVTKTGAAGDTLYVNYATANGSAIAPGDYTATSGTLTFLTSDTTKTISVPIVNDTDVESPETFTMSLSTPSGTATIGTGTATATINDNDTCSGVSFTIASNGAVAEGANSVLTITKAGTTGSTCYVSYATASGTATSGSDFTATSGTVTFLPSQTTQTVSVPTIDDTTTESAETFTMSLSSPTGGSVLGTPNSATATINDNDTATSCSGVSYSINDVGAAEGDVLSFTVTKSGSASNACSVNYATADGTAVAGTNYFATSGTLTFAASQTTAGINVQTIYQGLAISKSMTVQLSGATGGATISDNSGKGVISP